MARSIRTIWIRPVTATLTTKLHPKPTLAHEFSITFIKDQSGTSMVAQSVTLPALRDHILETTGTTKASLRWLKGARFGDKRTDQNSLRHGDNVVGFDMIELDYDQEVMSFDEAVTTLKAMDVRSLDLYDAKSYSRNAEVPVAVAGVAW